VTYHVTRIQLEDFETPDIPAGHTLTTIEITAQDGRTRYHRLYATSYPTPAAMIDSACLYVVQHVGWSNAKIELVLVRDDGEEGRMVYDCDSDTWVQFIDEIDAVPLGLMPTVTESDTPTNVNVVHPLLAELVTDEEAMEVER
jgi:hypothetical protein